MNGSKQSFLFNIAILDIIYFIHPCVVLYFIFISYETLLKYILHISPIRPTEEKECKTLYHGECFKKTEINFYHKYKRDCVLCSVYAYV